MKVEIFTNKRRPFPVSKFPGFQKEDYRKWSAKLNSRDAKKAVRKAHRMGFYARAFDEKYERAYSCRREFIRANRPVNGKYRCVYCGKKIPISKMEVDHVIPVSLAKESKRIQKKFSSSQGINVISNLVPSCSRCNMKKLNSGAMKWRIKASLGKHEAYWKFRRLLVVVFILLAIVVVFWGTKNPVGISDIAANFVAHAQTQF